MNSSAASSARKARSAARISATSPARRRRGSGHGGSRRVVTSSDRFEGGRSTSRTSPLCTSGELISCRLSRTTAIGSGARRSAAATAPGSSSAATAPAATRRSASPARASHDRHQPGRHRAPERVRVVVGLLEAHPHPLAVSVPGPQPRRREDRLAPARGGRDHGHRRTRRRGDRRVQAGPGDDVGHHRRRELLRRVPADRGARPRRTVPAHPCAFQDRPCVRGAEPGATMGNEYTFRVRGPISPDIRAALHACSRRGRS